MYHPNLNDTPENVMPKFKITEEEERVVREAITSYSIHRLKNRVVRESGAKYLDGDESSVGRYLELYPEYFESHGKNKLRVKGKSPADILNDYFISKGEPTDCKRWYNLARCVIAIGEHEASLLEVP